MENKKILTTIAPVIVLCSLFSVKIVYGFTNKFFEYGNDALIVILLLAFAEKILLLIFLTPFALFQKLKLLVFSSSNKSQTIIQNTNP